MLEKVLWISGALAAWYVIGYVLIKRRLRLSTERYERLEAITGASSYEPEEPQVDDRTFSKQARKFRFALRFAAVLDKLCWPVTAFDESRAAGFTLMTIAVISVLLGDGDEEEERETDDDERVD